MTSVTALLWRFPSAQMAWRNLGRNRVRTALATLGIVIGVIAIASLGITGAALQQQATSNLGSLSDEVTVTPGEDAPEEGITETQVQRIRGLATDAEVVPQRTDRTTISVRGREAFVRVSAVTRADVLYDVSRGEVPGRLYTGALLSASTARELGLELGDPVEYDGRLYRIRGLVASEQGFGGGGSRLVVPLSAPEDAEHYDSVTIVAEDGESAIAIAEAIEARFNDEGRAGRDAPRSAGGDTGRAGQRGGGRPGRDGGDEEVLNVQSYASVQENVGSFMNTLNLVLLGIGSISLFVASVAILNVMLMSTIERRGEIGVLRAVGIRRGEVLRMILTEATFLGAIGGLIGAVISLGIGLLIFDVVAGDPTLVFGWSSLRYLGIGFGFAVVASLLSGLYPAWKAANDHPVDALRG